MMPLADVWEGVRRGTIPVAVICLSVLTGAGVDAAVAQSTADAYFHEAARAYIANEVEAARRAVRAGLDVAPSDARLRALRNKLQKDRRPQRHRDSTSEENGQRENGSNDGDGTDGDGEGESRSGEESDETRPRPTASDSTSPEAGGGGQPGLSPRSPQEQPPMAAGRGGRPVDTLSRKQAERLLQALGGQERRLLRQLQRRSSTRETVEKDW